MADYDSALPVRTQEVDGSSVAATTPIFLVAGTDGTNYQALSTDSDGNLQVDVASGGMTWDNTNKVYVWDGTTDLSVAVDGATAKTNGLQILGTDGTNAQIVSTDSSGVVQTDLVSSLPAGTNNIGDVDIASIATGTNSIGTVGLDAGTNNIGEVDVASISTGTNSIGTIGLDAGTNDIGIIHLTDGTTELDVAIDGSAAKTNGLQVLGSDGTNATILKTTSSGELYVNTGGAPDDSLTHNTANLVKDTATTVVSEDGASTVAKVMASGSGLMKVEVKYGSTGSESTIAVLINSTANPNVELDFPNGLQVASGETLLLSCTNLEKSASPASDFSGYGSIVTTA